MNKNAKKTGNVEKKSKFTQNMWKILQKTEEKCIHILKNVEKYEI